MKKETLRIGMTCSPCAMPNVIETKNVLLIKMSCGGGMGGAQWDELVVDDGKEIPSNALRTFVLAVDGTEKTINTAFVVNITPKKMLRVYDDITEWRNYHKKEVKKACKERIFAIDREQKWVIVDAYFGDNAVVGDCKEEPFETLYSEEK